MLPRRTHRLGATLCASVITLIALFAFTTSSFALSSRILSTIKGTLAGDQAGVAAPAGDFNADGRPDVLVGLPGSDLGGTNSGAVYIQWGGRLNAPPLVVVGQAGELLGGAVAAAGDVNGDGWDDIILGAPLNDVGGPDAGAAYVLYGGPSPNTTPDLILVGAVALEQFGTVVASAGDMNRDGFDDVMVAAHLSDAGGTDSGRLWVFLGGSAPNATADLTITGAAGDRLGIWMAPLGDINADGYGDIVVSAWLNDAGGLDAGPAYVFHGGVILNPTPDLTLLGQAAGGLYGAPAASAGDVDGDGHPDLLVGNGFNDTAGPNAGAVFLYRGGPGMDAIADLTILGADASDLFGHTAASAGDVNGDGYADFVVGAPDGGPNADGLVYVYTGSQALDGTADLVLNGAPTADEFGGYIESLGDIDDDGYDDLVVGDYFDDLVANNAGQSYVIALFPYRLLLPSGGDILPAGGRILVEWLGHEVADLELSVDGGLTFEKVELSVGGLEVNTLELEIPEHPCPDGTVEVATDIEVRVRVTVAGQVATRANSVTSPTLHMVNYPRPSSVASLPAVQITNTPPDQIRAVITADLNADGYPDLVTGSPGSLSGAGRVQIYLGIAPTAAGGPKYQSTPLTLAPAGTLDAFGATLAVGDANADCVMDLVVAAPNADPGLPDAGRVYLYLGGASFDLGNDWIVNGTIPGEKLGSAAAMVDMNGDDYDDLVLGAPFSNVSGTNSGRVLVFYGGSTLDATSDLALNGQAAGDLFGTSIAGLPNPDGGLDWCEIFPWLCPVLSGAVLIGAPGSDVVLPDAGAAYIYAGGVGVDATVDEFMPGPPQANAHFGATVANVGDCNGDRIEDIAIGAPDEDSSLPPLTDNGRVRVQLFDPRCFVINPWPDPGPDPWFDVFDGLSSGDRLGVQITGVDLNYDGLSDVVMSAPNYDGPAGPDVGAVYAVWSDVRDPGSPVGGDIGPNHGVDPHFMVLGTIPNQKLGTVLTHVGPPDALGIVGPPQGSLAADGGDLPEPLLIRRRCIFRNAASSSSAGPSDRAQAVDYFIPRPMVGGDLAIVGDNGVLQVVDVNRYHLISPVGPGTWAVGSLQNVSWRGSEPAALQLSIDGGASFTTVATSPGGKAINSVSFRVPHLPTRFGSIRIIPWPPCPEPDPLGLTCPPLWGFAQTDTLMTIQSSVSLLMFSAQRTESGAELTWSTDPVVSDEGLAGYRLYRKQPAGAGEGDRIGPELIVEARYVDRDAQAGSMYRLTAVNGLGEELEVGRVSLALETVGLRAWPSPVTNRGVVTVMLAAPSAAPGVPATDLDVGVFDVGGRRVATLASGFVRAENGAVRLEWKPDREGARPGLYFVRATAPSARLRLERKVVVTP